MYPWQSALIKLHARRLGARPNRVTDFVRAHRIKSPEKEKKCTAGAHTIKFGEPVYIYDGNKTYCSDLGCFLEALPDGCVVR